MRFLSKFLFSLASVSFCFSESTYQWLVDPHMSPYSGGEDLLTLYKSLEKKEDQFFSYQESPKETVMAGVGRFAEMVLFWAPLSKLTVVVQHEVFGHGYRVRSLPDAKVTGYRIDPPFPYGASGGATFLSFAKDIPIGELQAITIAGSEAEYILAKQQMKKWISEKKIDARSAPLYETAKLGTFQYAAYTLSKKTLEDDILSGNDIEAYINTINLLYPEKHLTPQDVAKAMAFNILDPTLINCLVANWYYILKGKVMNQWMIPLGGELYYLPSISVQLAPFGIEYCLDNYFSYQGSPIYAYYKMGEYAGVRYGGAGIEFDEIYKGNVWSFGLRAHGWLQPKFVTSYSYQDYLDEIPQSPQSRADLETTRPGMALSLVTKYLINNTYTNFYAEVGGKTSGYLPGYSLSGSPVVRIGISGEF